MKRIITFFVSLIVTAIIPGAVSAQLTASNAFSKAPKTVFPLLDTNTRLDMIDYFNAGMSTESTNNLNGKSRLMSMEPLRLTAKLTDASTMELFLLPAPNDTLIGVITTVTMPGKDSSMNIYNRDWQKVRYQFVTPGLSDWLIDRSRSAEVEMITPFMLIAYSYDPATSVLTLTNSLGDFLSDDSSRTVNALLKPKLSYKWDGKKFKSINEP